MFRKLMLIFLVIVFTGGCTNQVANKNYQITEKNKGKGLVVLSITQTGQMQNGGFLGESPYPQTYIFKRNDKTKDKWIAPHPITLNTFKGVNSKNADFKGVAGELQMFELKPGDYKVDSYYINLALHTITWDYFEYYFTVNPGEITYIGNLNAEMQISNKNFLSDFLPSSFSAVIRVSDEYKRDIEVFRKKFPKLTEMEVFNSYNALKFGEKATDKYGR